MIRIKTTATSFLLALLLFACGGNSSEPSPADNTKDRKQILTHWVDNIVIPSYGNFTLKFDAMKVKAEDFMNFRNTESLHAFRNAWADAYTEWQKVELYEFGPADKYTLRNFFNIYPADVAGIAANIDNPAVNMDLPAAYPTQGFPALDYLINGVGPDDATIVAYYTTDAEAEKRIAYLERVITRMQGLLTNVVTEWGGYRETFINKTGLDIGSSMGNVVNAYVLYYERFIRSGKIGIPSGAAIGSGGVAYPEKVEGFYKRDISRELATHAHQTAINFFNGKTAGSDAKGPSFKSYLDALGAKDPASGKLLSEIINEQFALISAELEQLSPDLYEQIQTGNEQMIDVYAAMQKLVRMLKVDMTSAMSVTITYTDNDGD